MNKEILIEVLFKLYFKLNDLKDEENVKGMIFIAKKIAEVETQLLKLYL